MNSKDTFNTDPRDFRNALGCFATGVTVVTAGESSGQYAGVTANSFTSVSLSPPLVLWSLSENAPSRAIFAAASHFAIHVLSAEQENLSRHFARPSENKFAGIDLVPGLGGAPLIAGVAALLQCRLRHVYPAGDHILLIGEVEQYGYCDLAPLVFHRGQYTALAA